MKIKEIIKIAPLIILSLLVILLVRGRIRFGFGLGDLIYHGLGYIGWIIYSLYYFLTRKKASKELNLMFPIISLLFCGYMILTMTIWRGAEYRWNGDILVPTYKTIKEKIKKQKLEIKIEIMPEGKNGYSIAWEDTVGMKIKYGVLNRPLELWCHVQNTNMDTIGYYRGLSTPQTFTYFETSDTLVTVEFSKAFNFFNEAFSNEKQRKAFWERHKTPIKFESIKIDLNKQLRQEITIELEEK